MMSEKLNKKNVMASQQEQLLQFRVKHRARAIPAGNIQWEYIATGQGTETLLLLQGAGGVAESAFERILRFEPYYRIIAPTYPAEAITMRQLVQGVRQILDSENVRQTHILGHSIGGAVAQCFVRAYPERVKTICLANIGVASKARHWAARVLLAVLNLIPESLVSGFVLWRLQKGLRSLPSTQQEFYRAHLHDQAYRYLTKRRLLNQYRCMLDFIEDYRFTPTDLQDWNGRILILESADDPGWNAVERDALKHLYPKARVCSFQAGGHLAGATQRDRYDAVVAEFLQSGS